jgi:GAF domain-containing protein
MPLSAELLERHLGIRPTSTTEATLRMLIWTSLQLTGAQEGSLLVLDRSGNELRFAMTVGNEESEATLLDQPVPLGAGISGLAAASREVQIGAPKYRDIKQSQKIGTDPEAVIAAPILAGDELLGVLTCVSFEPGKRFGTEQGRLYGGFAVIAGVVIDQERRLARLERGTVAAADPREQRIMEIATRLGRERPDALTDAVAVLERIERLALGPATPRAA